MAFSYSFHLSTKSHSVGTSGKVAQVSRHNLREYASADYDRTRIEILKGSDTSILDDVKRIYHEEFDEALIRYNDGRRSDRQIGDYLSHVSDSRSDVACELIIQIGDKDFWADKTIDERKQMTYIFKDQLRSLERLVPELKIASAIVHYDEASPHMHVVGVPVADGYKKGLEKQAAKTKVFTADRLSYLQDRMRENAERGMKMPQNQNLFGEMELKAKGRGRNRDIPKESLTEFYQLQSDAEQLKENIGQQEKELAGNERMLLRQKNEIELYRRQISRYDEKIQEFQKKKDELKTEIEQQEEEKATENLNIKSLKLERGSLASQKEALEKDISNLKEEQKNLWQSIKDIHSKLKSEIQQIYKGVMMGLLNVKDAAERRDHTGAEQILSDTERNMNVQAAEIEQQHPEIPAWYITEKPQRMIDVTREQLRKEKSDDTGSESVQSAQKGSIREKLNKYAEEAKKGSTEPLQPLEPHVKHRPLRKGR